jgi:hypothetical protein
VATASDFVTVVTYNCKMTDSPKVPLSIYRLILAVVVCYDGNIFSRLKKIGVLRLVRLFNVGAMTFSIMTFSITTFSITTIGIMKLGTTTLLVTPLSKMGKDNLHADTQNNNTEHNDAKNDGHSADWALRHSS